MGNEVWKEIKGFEGWYEVSNLGRVRSVEREITHKCGKIQINPSKIKIPQLQKSGKGYLITQLFKNSSFKKKYIHRLVAAAFIPNPEEKPQVNHIDGNTQNNNANNLEWCTQIENNKHAIETGLQVKTKRVKRVNLNGDYVIFDSVTEAAKSVGANYTNGVSVACKENKPYKKFRWQFVE